MINKWGKQVLSILLTILIIVTLIPGSPLLAGTGEENSCCEEDCCDDTRKDPTICEDENHQWISGDCTKGCDLCDYIPDNHLFSNNLDLYCHQNPCERCSMTLSHVWGSWVDDGGGNCKRMCNLCNYINSQVHTRLWDDCTSCSICSAINLPRYCCTEQPCIFHAPFVATISVFAPASIIYGETLGSPAANIKNEIGGTSSFVFMFKGMQKNGIEYGPTTTPPKLPGTYTVTAVLVHDQYQGAETSTQFTIHQRPLTWTMGTVVNRLYNGTNVAEIDLQPTLEGIINNDDIHVQIGSVSFANANVGTSIQVQANNFGITGNDAWKYTLKQQPLFHNGTIVCENVMCVSIDPFNHKMAECGVHWQCSPNFNPYDHKLCPHPQCGQRLCNGQNHDIYTVTFKTNCGETIKTVYNVHHGHFIDTIDLSHLSECYQIEGWFTDGNFNEEWVFGSYGTKVLENTTLIAGGSVIHILSEWEIKLPATCTTTGIRSRSCVRSGCNHVENQFTPSLGHTTPIGNWVTVMEPSCNRTGMRVEWCTRNNCNVVIAQEVIEALGCVLSDWVMVEEAGVDTYGRKEILCLICNNVVEKLSIPPLGLGGNGGGAGNGMDPGHDENNGMGSGTGQGGETGTGIGVGQGDNAGIGAGQGGNAAAGTGGGQSGIGSGSESNNGTDTESDMDIGADYNYDPQVDDIQNSNEHNDVLSDMYMDDINDVYDQAIEYLPIDDELPLVERLTSIRSNSSFWILVVLGIIVPTGFLFFIIKHKKQSEEK